MVQVKKILSWTIPYFGNRHTMPYGKLLVTDGETEKVVSTKGNTLESFPRYGCQYIVFNRKPYEVRIGYNGNVKTLQLEPINQN